MGLPPPRFPNAPREYDGSYFDRVWQMIARWMNSDFAEETLALEAWTAIRTVTTSDSIGPTDHLILADTTGGDITLTLPSAATVLGQEFTIKRISGGVNTLTITSVSGNIDGSASITISVQYVSLSFKSDGTSYWII